MENFVNLCILFDSFLPNKQDSAHITYLFRFLYVHNYIYIHACEMRKYIRCASVGWDPMVGAVLK